MAIITTPGAGVSPYETTTAAPTILRASADGSTVSTSAAAAASTVTELAAATANTLVVVSGQAALNSLITSNQPGVFEGANVTINLEEQNFNTTNQVTSTINSPSGNTGEIQYNSGANSFASDPYFTYTNSNVITPGIRTNNYLYANGAPFLAGGNAAIGNFVFTGDNMTISHANSTLNINGNGTGNIDVTANGNTWTFGNNRILTLPGGPRIVPVGANLELQAASGGYAAITTSDGNSTVDVDGSGAHIVTSGINTWTFDNVGNLILPGNTFAVKYANGDTVAISTGGFPLANGTSNIDIATANGNVTVTANGSSTWTFNTDGNLTLPAAGNIVGAVNIIGNGTSNVNVIANSRAWTFAADGNLVLPLAGNIVNYGNTWNFGYDGNLTLPGNIIAINYANGNRVTGNVTFRNEIVIGTGTSNLISGLYLAPSSSSADADMYLRVRGNIMDEPTHIHFDTGNNQYYNQFIGDDNKYILLANTGNIVINSNDGLGNSAQWTFAADGGLTVPGDIVSANLIGTNSISAAGNVFGNNINANYNLSAFGNVYANSAILNFLASSANLQVSGTAEVGALSTVGSVSANGNITSLSAMYSGNGATWQSQVSLANVLFVGADIAEAYVQAAMINTGGNGSADWVSYSNNGNTAQGWIDMGITGNTFNDPAFELTNPNDGYILVQGTDISGTLLGGNLILATGTTGLAHDIVFATGGFTHANIKARLIDTTGEFSVVGNIVANNLSATNLVINSITSDDSTFVTIEDGLNVTSGLISAPANIALTAGSNDWTFAADGNLIFPTGMHITSDGYGGTRISLNSNVADIGLRISAGNTNAFASIGWSLDEIPGTGPVATIAFNTPVSQSNAQIITGNLSATQYRWTFDDSGNLTFPTGNLVIIPDYAAESNAAIISSTDHVLGLVSTGVNGGVQSVWVEDVANIFTSNTAAVRVSPISQIGNVQIQTGNNSSINTWNFGTDGNLTLPSSLIVPANSIITGEAGSPAASINGFNNIDANAFSASGNVTANNGMFTNIVNVASHTGAVVSVSGNITGGNILTAGAVKTGVFVTGTIPTASGVGAGSRAFVTDADSVTFGNLYTGGSGNAMPVWSNGTSWYIG
jgi:hypothetical protein